MEEYEGQIKGRQYLKVLISIDLLRANDKDLNEYLNDIDTLKSSSIIKTGSVSLFLIHSFQICKCER